MRELILCHQCGIVESFTNRKRLGNHVITPNRSLLVQSMKRNAEKLNGCGGRRNSKFTKASIKTAFMLSMLN